MLTAEQQAIRATGIGASEIASILGENPFQSSLDLWLVKTGRSDSSESLQTKMGHRSETIIADHFAELYGVRYAKGETIRHPEHAIVVATPDRIILDSDPLRLLECKNVGWRMLAKWRADGDTYRAPAYVTLQTTWQCGASDASGAHIAAWLGGRDWHDELVPFDAELFGDMVTIAERWWRDHVAKDVAPEPDSTKRAREALERLFPSAGRDLLSADEEVDALLRAYGTAHIREKEAKQEKQRIGNLLCSRIGDANGFVGELGTVTWTPDKNGRTAWAAVARELKAPAALIAKHTKAPSRTLRVKLTDLEEDDE